MGFFEVKGIRKSFGDVHVLRGIDFSIERGEVLSILGGGRQRIAVLGDMLELGAHSGALHDALGAYVAQNGDLSLFTYGEEAVHIASGALRGGVSQERIRHFEKDAGEALIAAVCKAAREDAVILFKASRAMRMERILEGVRRML